PGPEDPHAAVPLIYAAAPPFAAAAASAAGPPGPYFHPHFAHGAAMANGMANAGANDSEQQLFSVALSEALASVAAVAYGGEAGDELGMLSPALLGLSHVPLEAAASAPATAP